MDGKAQKTTITQSLRDFPNSEILSYFLGIPRTAISLK
jgi:hypothetical protein